MRKLTLALTAVAASAAAAPALAADLTVSVEIPRLTVAAYHRPYVALYIERPAMPGTPAAPVQSLAVWYETSNVEEGKDWLKDMRGWWRALGRGMTLPADGISSATKAPGQHTVTIPAARLRNLAPGNYVLVAEAARELGGRTVVRVPFVWGRPNTASGRGEVTSSAAGAVPELGAVSVTVTR